MTIGVLLVVLVAIAGSYTALDAEHAALQSEHSQVLQSLQTQTQAIVELRKQSVKHNFSSLEELRVWVDKWEVENRPIAVSILDRTFVIAGNDELYSYYWDCDDISEAMQRDALRNGYLMSIILVTVGGDDHAGCMAVADNGYWFIEPQTGEMKLVGRRD